MVCHSRNNSQKIAIIIARASSYYTALFSGNSKVFSQLSSPANIPFFLRVANIPFL
jgi:hypothetical protein